MCVIAYIPKGVRTPEYETIEAMYMANPHGMGMCTPTLAYKGLNFEQLLTKLEKRSVDEPCLLHFRLATHGSIKPMNCHPFWDKDTNTFFMHNGVLDIKPEGDKTDSETAFRRFFVPIIETYGLLSSEMTDVVDAIIGSSKFAFMQGEDVRLFGHFENVNGVYFSNLRFEFYLHDSCRYVVNL